MSECSKCGKTIDKNDSVYKDEETGKLFCGICYIQYLEKDIDDAEPEFVISEPEKKQNRNFIIALGGGIILIIAEILILSDARAGSGPASLPEKQDGIQEKGSIATRVFFIKELLMNYKAKKGEFPMALSLLTPEFVEPEITDESIKYELVEDLGFVLYSKDNDDRALEPILSAKGQLRPSELETINPPKK
jgi:transcription initiation factor TFIIIB Brf1 subunit/transcription initiation factor TFIIB